MFMIPHCTQSMAGGGGGVCLSSQLCREVQIGGFQFRLVPGIKWDPILKITNRKRAGGVAQVVDICLASIRPWVQPSVQPRKIRLDGLTLLFWQSKWKGLFSSSSFNGLLPELTRLLMTVSPLCYTPVRAHHVRVNKGWEPGWVSGC
jgi:hypothetical protein